MGNSPDNGGAVMDYDHRFTDHPFPTLWQRIRAKFTNKPVKYLTGSGKASTHGRDALPQDYSNADIARRGDGDFGDMK